MQKMTTREPDDEMKKGEQLSVSEMAYVKIFANLSDYERAEKSNYIKNDFYAEIERIANEKGIELPDTSYRAILNRVSFICFDFTKGIVIKILDKLWV